MAFLSFLAYLGGYTNVNFLTTSLIEVHFLRPGDRMRNAVMHTYKYCAVLKKVNQAEIMYKNIFPLRYLDIF